mmetsp:Transcript_11913/g.17492  ORF Transcript_11913/g.17492 Transcript_11913/m.17492 type:complete len:102 (-) Transcript_11913:727-1032(-)
MSTFYGLHVHLIHTQDNLQLTESKLLHETYQRSVLTNAGGGSIPFSFCHPTSGTLSLSPPIGEEYSVVNGCPSSVPSFTDILYWPLFNDLCKRNVTGFPFQ